MSMALLDNLDPYGQMRQGLRRIAADRGDWAGAPVVLDGQRLVIEPKYKYARLSEIGKPDESEPAVNVRNIFWSDRFHARIAIFEENGKFGFAPLVGTSHGLTAMLDTLKASDAWGIEQEHNAVKLLGSLVSHRKFKQYMLTGSFIETSKRSGIIYMFRRLRPTVAIRANEKGSRILCTLCMHPIAYYEGSWAGAMCPTDDVIAHLMMMRADEHLFWRRSNQHAPHDPGSGL